MTVLALDFETANERRDSACAVGIAWIASSATRSVSPRARAKAIT